MNGGGPGGGGNPACGALSGKVRPDAFDAGVSPGPTSSAGSRSKKSPIPDATRCAAPSASIILRFIAPAILGPAKTATAVASVKVAKVAPRLNPRSEPPGGVVLGIPDSSNFDDAARQPCHYPGDANSGDFPS